MSKSTLMKKVIDEKNVFINEAMVREDIIEKIQRSIPYIKYELQISIETNVLEGRKKEQSFWLHGDGLKLLLTMTPMEKLKKTMNITSKKIHILLTKKSSCVNITNCTH